MQNTVSPWGASGNIHGTACFRFVDLATIWFFLFAFSTAVFTLFEFAQENAVITSLALIKTFIYMRAVQESMPTTPQTTSDIFIGNLGSIPT